MNTEEMTEYLYSLQEIAIQDRITCNNSEERLISSTLKYISNLESDKKFLLDVCKLAIERNDRNSAIEIATVAKKFPGLTDEEYVQFYEISHDIYTYNNDIKGVNVAICYYRENHNHYWSIYPNGYIIIKGKQFIGVADTFEDCYNQAINEYGLKPGDFMITQVEDPRIKYVAQERPPNIIKIIQE